MTGPDQSKPTYRPPRTFGRRATSHGQRYGDMSVAALRSLLDDTLDVGYRAAAQRRAASTPGAAVTSSRRTQALVAVGVLVAGLVLGVAYRNTTRALPEQAEDRASLVRQVDAARSTTDTLQSQATSLRQLVTDTRNRLLGSSGPGQALLDQVTELEYNAAEIAVTGPGVRVTVGDPPPPQGVDPVGGDQAVSQQDVLILDRDLQQVCNALWAAGARAIAIDGQRLGPSTAIRQAGAAILVDFRPVASPYVVDAIGDTDDLTAGFAGSAIARKLATYRNVYNAQLQVDSASSLTLKAALPADLTYATAITDPASAASSSADTSSAAPTPSEPSSGSPP